MDAAVIAREDSFLKALLTEMEAALAESQEPNRRLEDILRTLQREKFGKRSEKLSPDQFNLPLEDAELAQGLLAAAQEKAEAAMQRARSEEPRKPTLHANKSETFDRLKFTLEGEGDRTHGNAFTDAAFSGCRT